MSTTSPLKAPVVQVDDDGALDRLFARANPRVLDRIERLPETLPMVYLNLTR